MKSATEGGPHAPMVRSVVDAATERIAAVGCEEPRADAVALVADALGLSIGDLLRDGAGELSPELVSAIEAAVARRVNHEPAGLHPRPR